jgi:ferritin-like metal-binding protein YciE
MASNDKILQYLEEAHAMETALVSTLAAHAAMAPEGSYRALLERHLDETEAHAAAVADRLDELGASASLIGAAAGLARTLAGQALALGKAPLDVLRGRMSLEEKVLKNARDECASEALEIATYDAIEAAARAAGDRLTARLAIKHRDDEERMLADLRREIPALAGGTAAPPNGAAPRTPGARQRQPAGAGF